MQQDPSERRLRGINRRFSIKDDSRKDAKGAKFGKTSLTADSRRLAQIR